MFAFAGTPPVPGLAYGTSCMGLLDWKLREGRGHSQYNREE